MGIWSDLAVWRGPTENCGDGDGNTGESADRMSEQRGLVVHIAEGYFEGTISWQLNPSSNVSSHFIVGRNGSIAQMVDTDVKAWTQSAGNGKWLSVENEGFTPNPLTPQQIEANAQLFARGHLAYGYPLQLAYNPDGRGLGHHSMGCNWPGGAWGHCDCPGDAIIAQKQQILDRARQIVNGDEMGLAEDPEWPYTSYRIEGLVLGREKTIGPHGGEAIAPNQALKRIESKVDGLAVGGIDYAALAEAMRPVVAQESEAAVRKVLGAVDGATPGA